MLGGRVPNTIHERYRAGEDAMRISAVLYAGHDAQQPFGGPDYAE